MCITHVRNRSTLEKCLLSSPGVSRQQQARQFALSKSVPPLMAMPNMCTLVLLSRSACGPTMAGADLAGTITVCAADAGRHR
jgi:hypothetical protein